MKTKSNNTSTINNSLDIKIVISIKMVGVTDSMVHLFDNFDKNYITI